VHDFSCILTIINLNRERDLVEDCAPRELALGHSRFDQSFPNAINKAKWVELAICEKWEDCVEEKVSENICFVY
jgi:hypothetical protein